MTIYLIRHASTEWNENKLWQGRKDLPLSDRGVEEAKALALRFASVDLDAVFSSPLTRALRTAEEIASVHGLEVRVIEDLKEADFSRWEGRPGERIKEEDREVYELWSSDPDAVIDGIEPVGSVHERALRVFEEISSFPGEEIAVVTHAMVLRMMVCHVLGMPLNSFRRFALSNTSVTTVSVNENGMWLVGLNDTSHLGRWGL